MCSDKNSSIKEKNREGIFLCLVAPAGGGKTTLADLLLKEFADSMKLSISMTSRAPRATETNGTEYIFVTRKEFEQKVKGGELFEWEETHGNLYGTLRASLEDAIQTGRDILFDIDIRGALTFKSAFPDNTVILLVVPPDQQTLIHRVKSRGASDEDLKTRLETARREYQAFLACKKDISYLVVNDNLMDTFRVVSGIVFSERAKIARMSSNYLSTLCSLDLAI